MNFITRFFKNNGLKGKLLTINLATLLVISTMIIFSVLIPLSHSEELVVTPNICIEKLVDFDGDDVFHEFEVGSYDGTATWMINVTNCGDSPLFDVFVNDSNGMNWGPFNLAVGESWVETYDEMNILSDKCNNASAEGVDVSGVCVDPVFDEACVEVQINPNINIIKSADIVCGTPSTNVNYTIIVENTGDCVLDPVIVEDTLPLGMSYVSDDSGGSHSAGVVTWNIGPMNPSGLMNITLITKSSEQYNEIWVDDSWYSQTTVDVFDSDLVWQVDAFNCIQGGVDAVNPGGIVHVRNGTYIEQVLINKSISLLADSDVSLKLPTLLDYYTIEGSSGSWAPVIFAYGGQMLGNQVSGNVTIGMIVDGFKITSNFEMNSTGILYHNVDCGIYQNFFNNTVTVTASPYCSDIIVMDDDYAQFASDVYLESVISNNTIIDVDIGIMLDGCSNCGMIVYNHIEWPYGTIGKIGILISDSGDCEPENIEIHFNHIGVDCGDNYGVLNQVGNMVNATLNWWSNPDGPDSPLEFDVFDPVTGRIADGFGEKVGGLVHFDPWAGIDACMTVSKMSAMVGEPIFFDSDNSFACHINGSFYDFYDVQWKFDDGFYSFNDATSHIYNTPGVYEVSLRLRAVDMHLWPFFMIDWDRTIITISEPGMPLIANADAQDLSVYEGEPESMVHFYSYAIGGTPPYTYTWDFGDGSVPQNGQNPTHVYVDDDIYSVSLTVLDRAGVEMVDAAEVIVSSGLLSGYMNAPSFAYVDDSVHFSGYVTGGSDPYTYTWDFGDGSSLENGKNVSHVYEISGNYLITLSVSDGKGNIDSVSHELMVNMVKPEGYVEVCVLNNGWNFVSLNFNNSVDKTVILLNNDGYLYRLDDGLINSYLYGWNRPGQYYSLTHTLESGNGYWIFAYQNCELWLEKINSNDDNYITTLKPGWNIIGLPFEQSINKEDVIVNGETWSSAVNNEWINDYIFGWDRTGQYYDFIDILIPGYSYWMYASQSCILRRSV